jgi:hypothetical protein
MLLLEYEFPREMFTIIVEATSFSTFIRAILFRGINGSFLGVSDEENVSTPQAKTEEHARIP